MSCFNNTAVLGCFDNGGIRTTVEVQRVLDNAGDPYTIYLDAAGAPVDTSAGTVKLGACPVASPDVEYEKLCDVQLDGSKIPFFRRSVTVFNPDGSNTVTVDDWQLDKLTSYTIVGVVGDCPMCPELPARGVQTAWPFA